MFGLTRLRVLLGSFAVEDRKLSKSGFSVIFHKVEPGSMVQIMFLLPLEAKHPSGVS